MLGKSVYGVLCALAISLVGATGLQAQARLASTDSLDTYVTPDGYGLGKILPGSLTDVTARARAVMIRMRIVEERGRSLGHGWRELRGKQGPADVVIRLKSQTAASTRVEVTARRGLAEYDEGVAERVLDAIGGSRN